MKREDQRRERVRRKKMQARKKVGKSRNTVFFQWFVAPEGRTVGSLERRVRSHLGRWEMKNCTRLWREAHSEVKSVKNWRSQTTFGSWDVEKVHAVVARSTFRSQKCRKLTVSDHFWKLRCRKSARPCGTKHISKSKVQKTHGVRAFLDVQMSFRVAAARDCAPGSKTWGFCSISKNDGRRGTFEEDLQRCISRGRRSTRDTFIRAVRRSGNWFPERGCILEHQIFRFAKMILRDRGSTSYDLASLFHGRRYFRQMEWKNLRTHWYEVASSALNRIVSFLTLPRSKLEEVSQNSFVFKLAERQIDR